MCPICGIRGHLVCREQWRYDDHTGIATITGFDMLCPDCHRAIHIGHAQLHGHWENALAHLSRVNNITHHEAETLAQEALTLWRERRQKTWTLAVSEPLLRRYPQLQILIGNFVAPPPNDTTREPIRRVS